MAQYAVLEDDPIKWQWMEANGCKQHATAYNDNAKQWNMHIHCFCYGLTTEQTIWPTLSEEAMCESMLSQAGDPQC